MNLHTVIVLIPYVLSALALTLAIFANWLTSKEYDSVAYSRGRTDACLGMDNSEQYRGDQSRLKLYQNGLNWHKDKTNSWEARVTK